MPDLTQDTPPPGFNEYADSVAAPPPADTAPPPGFNEAGDAALNEDKFGTPIEEAKTAAEGVASGVLSKPIATALEVAAGVPAKNIKARATTNPGIHTAAEIAGLAGSAIGGGGEGALLGKLGEAGAAAAGLAAPATALAKIGSAAVKGAVENAAFSAVDDTTKLIYGEDPKSVAESALVNTGISALIGGTLGGTIGSVSPLWQAALGSKTTSILRAVADKMGGIEGEAIKTPIDDVIQRSGMELPPSVRAVASGDATLQEWASKLGQTDTSKAGKQFQTDLEETYKQASEKAAEALGVPASDVPSKGDISHYEYGKDIGNTLATEFDEKIKPVAEGYDAYKNRYSDIPLNMSKDDRISFAEAAQGRIEKQIATLNKQLKIAINSNAPSKAIELQNKLQSTLDQYRIVKEADNIPGTIDSLQDKLGKLAIKEGWTISPSSDVMRELTRVTRELPNLKTLKDLSNYIKQVGENTASTLPFGQQTPVSRAGGMIKSILRDAEGDILGNHIGSEEGEEALAAYRQTQQDFKRVAGIKDAIDERLRAHGSVSGFGKAVRNMAQSDGEAVVKRLSGRGDASLLPVLTKEFPETAAKIAEYHRLTLLAAAKDGDRISVNKLASAMDKMSPELRDFSIAQPIQEKVQSIRTVLSTLYDQNHNWSNTARTLDKIFKGHLGSATGFLAAILGHNPALGFLLGKLGEYTQREAPDAIKYSLMKFLGSANKVDGSGFKGAADFIHNAIRGDNLVKRSTSAIFKSGRIVLPESLMPTEGGRKKLDEQARSMLTDPSMLNNVGEHAAYYMPEHGQALAETAGTVLNYINNARPVPAQRAPLDAKREPSPDKVTQFNRVLDIAEQPLTVMRDIQSGRLKSSDVVALRSMYPALYGKLSQHLLQGANEAMSKGNVIPYKERLSLSLFLGQPLDSTMSPQAIMAAQPVPKGGPSPQGPQPKHSTSSLNKLASNYQTPGQSAEARKTKA